MNENVKEIIGQEIKCLDHGFVRLVDIMGDDSSIVQAARVSYGKGTKSVSEDRGLIRYLMRNRHTSPFEMVEFKFHIKLPIFIARQWIRHRTANVNEYSGRYSEMRDDFYLPELQQVRPQSQQNKQGRAETTLPPTESSQIIERMNAAQKHLFEEYSKLLDVGLARELARINLPLSTYTEWYWKIDLHNLFHFLNLRLSGHAQYEIRVYAEKIAEIVEKACPQSYEAFSDYILNGILLSKAEQKALKMMLNNEPQEKELIELGLSKREVNEFMEKLNRIREDE